MSWQSKHCVEPKPFSSNELQGLSVDELARRAQSGDAAAFAALAALVRPGLLVVLVKRMNGQYADAEDIAQDALTRAWQHIDSYDCQRSFLSWIYTIANRRATDYVRHRRSQKISEELPRTDLATSESSQTLEVHETVENIWSVAKRILSNAQFQALWLRYAEELPVREIAITIGKSVVGTRVLLHRARSRIRKQLGCMSDFDE